MNRSSDSRVRRVRSILPTVVALALLATSCDWARWRFDSANTGANVNDTALTAANAGSLGLRWQAQTAAAVTGSTAIVGKVAYVGSTDGNLYAFDATARTRCTGSTPRTCDPLWKAGTGGEIQASPAVAGGKVFITSGDGKVHAFAANPAPGACSSASTPVCPALWTVSTGAAITSSSPNVVGDTLYVGSTDGKLWAISTSGAVLWTAQTGGAIKSSPAVTGGRVFVGSDDGKLYAFDATAGASCTGAAPATTCLPVWTGTTTGAIRSSPAVSSGRVYVGSEDRKLYAFDATATGTSAPLWSYTTGGPVTSSPAVANGTVLVGSGDGSLYALSSAGALLWKANPGGFLVSSPSVAGSLAFIASTNGSVNAYDLGGSVGCSGTPKVCAPLWSAAAGAVVYASPTIADGTVIIGTGSGSVRAWHLPVTPEAPAAPTAALTPAGPSGHIDVAWTAPVDDGGAAITGYRLEVSTNAGGAWSTVASYPATTTSADHYCGAVGASCTFRVSASNAAGESTPSGTSTPVTIPTPNSPPVFSLGASPTVNASAGAQTIPGFATIASPGPLGTEAVTFTVTNDNTSRFAAQPAISSAGTLTFTPLAAAPTSVVTVYVTAKNDGGTLNGGVDTSGTRTFSISINAVNQPPTVSARSAATRANTRRTASAPGVLTGASDPEGGPVHICTPGTTTTTKGGSFTVASNGSYTYDPKAGFVGNDTASFSVCDASNASTPSSLSMRVDGPAIWYVDGTAAVNGDGRDQTPFNTLASANAASASGDTIYLAKSGTGANAGIALKANVKLIGAGVILVRTPSSNLAAGTAPTITNTGGGPVVALASGNTVSGVIVSGATSAVGAVGISGASIAGATITSASASGNVGPAIRLLDATGAVTLTSVTATGSGADAIEVRNRTAGTLTASISGSTVTGTPDGGNGLMVRTGSAGASPSVTVTVSATTFSAISTDEDAINAATVNSAASTLVLGVTGSSFDNAVGGAPSGDNAIRVSNDGAGATLGLGIDHNTFANWLGDVISIRARGSNAQVQGIDGAHPAAVVDQNTIGSATATGSVNGRAIRVLLDPRAGATSTRARVDITGNQIRNVGAGGILVGSRRGIAPVASNLLRATVRGNEVTLTFPTTNPGYAFTTSGSTQLCAAVDSNVANTSINLGQTGGSSLGIVGTPGFPGQSAASYLDAQNTLVLPSIATGSPVLVAPNTGGCGNP